MNEANLAEELNITEEQIKKINSLITDGCSIPFIARYRKDFTGGVSEVELEKISDFFLKKQKFEKRKLSIIKSLEELDVIDDNLIEKLNLSKNIQELENVYFPYKSKKATKVDIAIKNGLKPLAKTLMAQKKGGINKLIPKYINDKLKSEKEIIDGVIEIASLWISQRNSVKYKLKNLFLNTGILKTKLKKGKEIEGEKYKDYFDYEEKVSKILSHRFLAIYRANKEGVINISLITDKERAIRIIEHFILKKKNPILSKAILNSYNKYLKPSIETETKNILKNKFEEQSIELFSKNLKQLLLQPPIKNKRILAIDPGFKSGCKIVCLNDNGDLMYNDTIFPTPPKKDIYTSKKKILTLIEQYKIDAIALGNGTASRETEYFLKNIKYRKDISIHIVNEAGASIYSASKLAREEFPNYDITVRGAVSIGRRLIDPLAELIKIEPKNLGIGQYQHDVNQKKLKAKLDFVVESCVNSVGINLNTASKHLLSYISGIGSKTADNIVTFRKNNGSFKSREELIKVPKLGKKAFEQASGFLRVPESKNPLDNSRIHPENYDLILNIAKENNKSISEFIADKKLINSINWNNYVNNEIGKHTIEDIKQELLQPNKDPRKRIEKFSFANIKSIEDIEIGMILLGIANNITSFGVFVDIGIKENGLIHISELSNKFLTNPTDVVSLQQHVKARVISVDKDRKRISLSLKTNN